jgi:hypothetical protein
MPRLRTFVDIVRGVVSAVEVILNPPGLSNSTASVLRRYDNTKTDFTDSQVPCGRSRPHSVRWQVPHHRANTPNRRTRSCRTTLWKLADGPICSNPHLPVSEHL